MTEQFKKKQLIKIISKLLETNIELMTYYKFMASDEKSKRVCSKSIRQSKKALEKLPRTQHIEILVSLYNTLISGKEFMFVASASYICSKNFDRWDKTKKGFKEFMEIEEEGKKLQRQKIEEQEKKRKTIEEAKAQGKKVEMVYNPKTKKLEPLIVEDKEDN